MASWFCGDTTVFYEKGEGLGSIDDRGKLIEINTYLYINQQAMVIDKNRGGNGDEAVLYRN